MPIFHHSPTPMLDLLQELALDLHWSWNHADDLLWQTVNNEVWNQTQNPVSVLQLTSDKELQALETNQEFIRLLHMRVEAKQAYRSAPSWYSTHYLSNEKKAAPLKGIAYFSMEFGLCEALPLYAGGLGILAGDYLKTASDLGVPLVGIGLLYQQGYFHQRFSNDGWQQESYLFNDPSSLPIQPLYTETGNWLHIETHFLFHPVSFRVWYVQIGRTTLYLLDSNAPCNQPSDRDITSALYGGNIERRLLQELALGICGWRLIEILGLNIDVCHLNEGHAAFATLERANAYRQRHKVNFEQALWATRGGNVFTSHTAVAAGFDRYPETLLCPYINELAQQLGVEVDVILALGRNPSQRVEIQQESLFNMAYLAMNTCARTNGVSQLHQSVSKHIFQPLFVRWPEREVPVSHVTNGVHVPSWDSKWADKVWTDFCGKERWRCDPHTLTAIALSQLTDTALWQMITAERAQLIDYVRQRIIYQQHQSKPQTLLDPNILTLGFARRFASYKRADLLLHDTDRLTRLLCNNQYPVQIIVAGKAHPADDLGKHTLQRWQHFVRQSSVSQHVVFVEDYDLALAQHLVEGIDLWVNTPRRPWEACGTSGMKVLVNGGLNISTLDGWWAEAYQPGLGWAISSGDRKFPDEQDDDGRDAEQLYQLLENEIVPLFYQRDEQGLPTKWISCIRNSMTKLTPQFSSNRMLQEYLETLYFPAAQDTAVRQQNDSFLAKELLQWHKHLHQHWNEIHISELQLHKHEQGWNLEVIVFMGGIHPDMIEVQIVADANAQQPAQCITLTLLYAVEYAINAYRYGCQLSTSRPSQDYTVRVISFHPHAMIPAENKLIYWQPENARFKYL